MTVLEVIYTSATALAVGAWWGKRLVRWALRRKRVEIKVARKRVRELRTRAIVRDELHRILDARMPHDEATRRADRWEVN